MIYTDQTCVKKKKKLNIRGWVAIMIIIATLCCLFIGHKTRHYYSVEVSDFNGLTASATKLQTGQTSTIMSANRTYLQELMDTVSNNGGGEIYLPAGTFYFNSAGKAANGTANYEYCLVPRDNVKIIGKGERTILKPYGTVQEGLDLFYYNSVTENIRDGSRYKYLTNADFSSFVIDGDEAHCIVYNSSGKGFMINIFKNCDWDNVIVKNTIATGFGMDCPIDCSIMNCKAIGCGREADKAIGGGGENAKGASGFGIGTGYVDDESIYIDGCVANNNYKYGFFFEHQGYYLKNTYTATGTSNRFVVNDCLAEGNMYDFGGFRAYDCVFQNCTSTSTNSDGNNKCPLSFGENTVRSYFVNMNVMRTFTDVPMSNQYYTAIDWALKNGVVNGTTSNSFSPNTSIKRGDAVEIIYRSCNLDGVLFRGRDNADYESNLYSFY